MLEALGTTSNFPGAANSSPDMHEFFQGTPTAPSGVVQILAPTANTASSPLRAVARASAVNPITAMRIYLDNISVALVRSNHIDTSVSMPKGKHLLVFQAWDSRGNVYKTPKIVEVR
jgi:hypothetical protein